MKVDAGSSFNSRAALFMSIMGESGSGLWWT